MSIQDLVHVNFDLLSVIVSITGIVLLGVLIYSNAPRSATNRAFLFFALLTAVWGISNYLEYRFSTVFATLWALRLHLFVSVFHAYAFFSLAYVFPAERISFPRWFRVYLKPLVWVTAVLTLTPFVFSSVAVLAPAGQVTRATPAPGMLLFMLVAFGLLISALVTLSIKTYHARGVARPQHLSVLAGMTLTACLLLVFNVILPNVFNQLSFIPLAALFILPFIALTSYAIYRHHLLNLKVATTAFLGFMVTVFTFVNILYSKDISGIVINVTAFVIVLLGSIKIVRDTLSLVEQRELIEKQEKELEIVNRQQEGLLHFISHEVKGYLTKGEGAFAEIANGDYGNIPAAVKTLSAGALVEMRKGVATVMDILSASDLKKGTMSFKKDSFDFQVAVMQVLHDLAGVAEEKGLTIDTGIAWEGNYLMQGDEEKIRAHVIRNLVDNAVKYTPSGSVRVELLRTDGKIRFAVKDSGVGITPEDMANLFTEGGMGKDSLKVNTHSTGYGLFIAKSVVEAHGGKIWAESEGAGKGSRFVVEFPAQSG